MRYNYKRNIFWINSSLLYGAGMAKLRPTKHFLASPVMNSVVIEQQIVRKYLKKLEWPVLGIKMSKKCDTF